MGKTVAQTSNSQMCFLWICEPTRSVVCKSTPGGPGPRLAVLPQNGHVPCGQVMDLGKRRLLVCAVAIVPQLRVVVGVKGDVWASMPPALTFPVELWRGA